MDRLRTIFFESAGRRLAATIGLVGAFVGYARMCHQYIDERCASAGLAFLLVVVWIALALLVSLVVVAAVAAGRRRPSWDDGLEDEDDAAVAAISELSGRWAFYFLVVAGCGILATDRMSGGFLGRFQHPGFAVINMRSDDPADRRRGLVSLTQRLDFEVTPAVTEVVLPAMDDPDEGVAARAAFVAGYLRIPTAAPGLVRMARTRPALTFTSLIALGQIGPEHARELGRTIVDDPNAIAEPHAHALMLGMLRIPAIERLREIWREAENDDTRIAAVWALGELKEPKLAEFMLQALESESLGIRCAVVDALVGMSVFEASPALRAEFESVDDPDLTCPQIKVPVQEGGAGKVIVSFRNYQLAIVRALDMTHDPDLIPWLVSHQEGVHWRTHTLMEKLWKRLTADKTAGRLNSQLRKLQLRKLQAADAMQRAEAGHDGTDDDASSADAGAP